MNEPISAEWADESFNTQTKGKLLVTFEIRQKKMPYLSEQQQRPVFQEVVFIKKVVPGDNSLTIHRQIRPEDKEEYPQQWAHFQRTQQNKQPGIPIEHWHSISDTQKAEFKAWNILTIEQFANLPDSMANKIMGFYELRKKALVFIEAGKDAELIGQIRAEAKKENDALRSELEELRNMIAAQKPKGRPGRKPRVQEAEEPTA